MITKNELETLLKEAMRSGNDVRKRTLRMVLSAIKLAEIDKSQALDETGIAGILQKEIKSRRESIADAQRANRPNIIKAVEAEIAVIEGFLPKALAPRKTKLLLKDSRVSQPWCDTDVPSDPSDLRIAVYELRPETLLPVLPANTPDALAVTLSFAVRECFPRCLVSLIQFGSSLRGEAGRDKDFLILVDESFRRSPRRLLKYVTDYLRGTFKSSLSIDLLPLTAFLTRLSYGDPLCLIIAFEGMCLLDSAAFSAMHRLALQPLFFRRDALVTMLLHFAKHESDLLEQPQPAFDQIQGVYRAIVALTQSVLIVLADESHVASEMVRGLSSIQSLCGRLTAVSVPNALLDAFQKVVAEFKSSVPPCEPAPREPLAETRQAALSMWTSFASNVVEARK